MDGLLDGRTGLIVPVPAAEPVVAEHRAAHDSSAALGVPAHVTVLFPFLPWDEVDDAVLADLGRIAREVPVADLVLRRASRFPGVLWLVPEPADTFVALTAASVARWPDHQPYAGTFAEVVPHLTVAEGPPEVLDEVEHRLTGLPVTARAEELVLICFDGRRWTARCRWALG